MEERSVGKSQKLLINNRKDGSITGVKDVISFDLEEIKVETEMGLLVIKGNDMHVKRLNLEKGEIDVEGTMNSFTYTEQKRLADKESFLSRMFK